LREEKQFHSITRRMKDEAPEPWYQRLSLRLGITALTASAAVLTLTLFDIDLGRLYPHLGDDAELAGEIAVSPATIAGEDAPPSVAWQDLVETSGQGGIEHPAQSYGRVVGGNALVVPPGGQVVNTNTFPVGTRFEVGPSDPLQIGLVGKIVANFTPGAEAEWTVASPVLIELRLDRGVAAFRYDRKPSDPILQVRTPNAVVRVIGTVFTVQVDADNDTLVSVLRGQVEVLDPQSNRLVAEVESGYRLDVARGMFDDVGKVEVQAALPLSNDVADASDPDESVALADGRIPQSWNVPGLPTDPQFRTLAYVPARPGNPVFQAPSIRITGTTGANDDVPEVAPRTETRDVEDEGTPLIEELIRELESTRRKELLGSLENCRELYNSHEARYRAAKCLSTFISKYGDDPLRGWTSTTPCPRPRWTGPNRRRSPRFTTFIR
jgi:hypothetical protein